MNNLSIYKAICIGIIITVVTSVLSTMIGIVFMASPKAIISATIIMQIVALAWSAFFIYKIWSVRELNSGFKKFSTYGLIIYVLSFIMGVFSTINSVMSIGTVEKLSANTNMDLSSISITGIDRIDNIIKGVGTPEGNEVLAKFAIISSIVLAIFAILAIYMAYNYYMGLFEGTEELATEKEASISEVQKIEIVERGKSIRKITKVIILYLPIIAIAIAIIGGILISKGILAAIFIIMLMVIAALVAYVVFLVKLYQYSSLYLCQENGQCSYVIF